MAPFERLGPYVIERSLGSGGMGSVLLGVNEQTGERVAVKVLAPGLAADESFRERFRTEVETLKKLKHPNIVQLLGFGEQDGHLFYTMEMVDGRTLQEEIQAGRRFSWREVARVGVQVCQALKHAHDRGIIHRDLKPANLLWTADEQIKLADFGIAKLYGMTQLTAEGGVLGTADYMSPEQAEGKGVTSRSDLYSLGSVMYVLLAGKPPFSGGTLPEVVHKLRYDEAIPIGRLAPDVPAEFELIISQLLEKAPEQRIATALAVANRLKAMAFALSMETRVAAGTDDPASTEDKEYDLADGAKQGEPPDPNIPTRVHTSAQDFDLGSASYQQHQNTTMAMSELAETDKPPQDLQQTGTTHFTTYDEEARQRATEQSSSEDGVPLWLKVVPFLLAGGLIALGIWYVSKPASAESLYGKISKVAKDGETRDLATVEDSIGEFLSRFPDHDRRDEVNALREELELYRLERRYERRVKLRGGTDSLGTIERTYLNAVRDAEIDPHGACTRLQAFLDVYFGAAHEKQDEQCLKLAKEQLQRLKVQSQAVAAEDLKLIRQRLDAADELGETDANQAAAIRQGVIDLYGQEPWAQAVVRRAREALSVE